MRTQTQNDLIQKLNTLIEKNYDAAEGYKKAAAHAESPALKGFLNDYSVQREQFVIDLRNEVRYLGGNPEESGSVTGDLHRAWMDMKSAVSTNKDQAVLQECVTGERASLDEYTEILEDAQFHLTTEKLLKNQKLAIENAYRRVRQIENQL